MLKEQKKANPGKYSFNAWLISCIGRATSENKRIHALPHKKKQLVTFDDVDISVVIERKRPEDTIPGETLAMPYIIRKANEKSIEQLQNEMRSAQDEKIINGQVRLGVKNSVKEDILFNGLPKFLRHLYFWRRVDRDAFLFKKTLGTVVVSSVSNLTVNWGNFWGVSRSIHPVSILIGSIVKKPAFENDVVVEREYLCMTIGIRHELVDGAPQLRFIQTLRDLMTAGYGLKD